MTMERKVYPGTAKNIEEPYMEIIVPVPTKVQVDNVCVIWLANNSSVSERTKHVD